MGATEQRILQTHFGAFLKMRRDQWGVTQREVLHYFPGWTQANYSRLESGERVLVDARERPVRLSRHAISVERSGRDASAG